MTNRNAQCLIYMVSINYIKTMKMKLKLEIEPRFCELDGLGHINNASFLFWFEQARTPLFKYFNKDLELDKWNLIIARNEVDYFAPVELTPFVEIETFFSKIGNSSMQIEHILYQNGVKKAHGKSFMIHYDYKAEKSVKIPSHIREKLESHLFSIND